MSTEKPAKTAPLQMSSYMASHVVIHPAIRQSWTLLAPFVLELAHHHLGHLDHRLRDDQRYMLFRHEVLPRLMGCSYETAPVRDTASGIARRRASGQLAADQALDALRCFNFMRAKAWALLLKGDRHIETRVVQWLEHLTLQLSLRDDIAHVNLQEMGESLYTLISQDRTTSDYSNVSGDARSTTEDGIGANRLHLVLHDKFLPLIDFIEMLPQGMQELEAFLENVLFTIRRARLSLQPDILPDYAGIPFSHYNGEIGPVDKHGDPCAAPTMRTRSSMAGADFRETALTQKDVNEQTSSALLADWHKRRAHCLLNADTQPVTGLGYFALIATRGFDTVRSQADRWRWLATAPGAVSRVREMMGELPKSLEGVAAGEYLGIRVDIEIHESGWQSPFMDQDVSEVVLPEAGAAYPRASGFEHESDAEQDVNNDTTDPELHPVPQGPQAVDAMWWTWLVAQQPARFAEPAPSQSRDPKVGGDWLDHIERHLSNTHLVNEVGSRAPLQLLCSYLVSVGAVPHSPRPRRPVLPSERTKRNATRKGSAASATTS